MVGMLMTGAGRVKGNIRTGRRVATMTDGVGVRDCRTAARDKAYVLDLLGDCHKGLGRHDAAIEAYQQASQLLLAQGA